MKKTLFFSTLISFAMICSCQKQDSTAETQLAQRKTELDAREEAVVQREKAVEQREKAVAEREKAVTTSRVIQPQRQPLDRAQVEAERQRRIEQLSPELRALIPNPSRMNAARAAKDTVTQQRAAQTQRAVEAARKNKMAVTASPDAQVPLVDATSPSPSPTPE